jgi:hypothetical protein
VARVSQGKRRGHAANQDRIEEPELELGSTGDHPVT